MSKPPMDYPMSVASPERNITNMTIPELITLHGKLENVHRGFQECFDALHPRYPNDGGLVHGLSSNEVKDAMIDMQNRILNQIGYVTLKGTP